MAEKLQREVDVVEIDLRQCTMFKSDALETSGDRMGVAGAAQHDLEVV